MDLMTKYKKIYTEVNGDQLQADMEGIAADAVSDIVKGGRWQHSPATEKAEDEAVKIQHDVIRGKDNIINFKDAVERWKAAGTR